MTLEGLVVGVVVLAAAALLAGRAFRRTRPAAPGSCCGAKPPPGPGDPR